ncbi:MAG TPA: T9SS type A sorting domain-containing protein [Pelobium sp.]|nr:T9SS type A sorting domain-containing protein [Pelobium sp.]
MKSKLLGIFCCIIILFGVFITVNAQTKSFPGAEGVGAFTSGGRGTSAIPTTVFEVTNLTDVNSPGSLRYALSASATYRTIVFRVSGTIHLNSRLSIKGNTTIAGQTAPGGGICIADYPVSIGGDNVIIRYLRFRMGDKNQNKGMVDGSGGDDALGDLGHKNIIIDHCSVSWSTDEALTVYRGDSVTLQWNLISEPLNYSYHFETGDTDFEHHGYGGIWGGRHASFHHNLIASAKNRCPRFSGVYNGIADTCDFRNNVIYNWGINNIYGGEGGFYNVVNNYFKKGPSTTSRPYQMVGVDYSDTQPYAKYYLTGNYMVGAPAFTASNWKSVTMKSGSLADTIQSKVSTPFVAPVLASETSAEQAYIDVLANVGATLPARDTLDQRIINDVRNGTGRIIDVQGGFPHGTAYALTVNAWPTLASTTPPVDTDHDGMPDVYESANALDLNDPSDRNIRNSDGYTNLEVYLNTIVASNEPPNPGATTFSATWPLVSDQEAAPVTGDVIATAQTTDPNMTVKNYASFSAGSANDGSFVPYTAQRVYPNGGNTSTPIGWPANQSDDVSNQWVEYKVQPAGGKDLKVTDISLDFGPSGSTATMKANLEYSLDNFATPGVKLNGDTPITLPALVKNDNSYLNIAYAGLDIKVKAGATFSLRVYPWWPLGDGSATKYLVEKNVVISGESSATLPLDFLSFDALLNKTTTTNKVDLNWQTTNEINVSSFEIQKSTDGELFTTIGTLSAKNTAGTHRYYFSDKNSSEGVSYYKIKQLDINGDFKFSKVIFITNNAVQHLNVYPNPVKEGFTLNHQPSSAGAQINITSLKGDVLINIGSRTGSTFDQVNVSNLPAGYYIVTFINQNKKESVQFVKK